MTATHSDRPDSRVDPTHVQDWNRLWCTVAATEMRTRDLAIANPTLYQSAAV